MSRTEVIRSDDRIEVFFDGRAVYSDAIDHWQNAFLRLMDLTDEQAIEFISRVGEISGEEVDIPLEDSLRIAWNRGEEPAGSAVRPRAPRWFSTGSAECRWETSRVRDSRDVGLVTDGGRNHGWLADLRSGEAVSAEDVSYEADYFEGGRPDLGYGSYRAQSTWREEKAHRQCREVAALRRYRGLPDSSLRVLDVGSGYGYFIRAAREAGWTCEGIEISRHAAEVSAEIAGCNPFVGSISQYAATNDARFDVIVMWDFIEHVEDPVEVGRIACGLLADGGSLFVRTPNLHAIEFMVFGADYHSLKREHLSVFSPTSITDLFHRSGLVKPVILSEGHLLDGFVGFRADAHAAVLRGSDLLAMASKGYRGASPS